jgi:hypothetical protein
MTDGPSKKTVNLKPIRIAVTGLTPQETEVNKVESMSSQDQNKDRQLYRGLPKTQS